MLNSIHFLGNNYSYKNSSSCKMSFGDKKTGDSFSLSFGNNKRTELDELRKQIGYRKSDYKNRPDIINRELVKLLEPIKAFGLHKFHGSDKTAAVELFLENIENEAPNSALDVCVELGNHLYGDFEGNDCKICHDKVIKKIISLDRKDTKIDDYVNSALGEILNGYVFETFEKRPLSEEEKIGVLTDIAKNVNQSNPCKGADYTNMKLRREVKNIKSGNIEDLIKLLDKNEDKRKKLVR